MGHGERVVTGSFLGKAEFTFQAKKKKSCSGLFVSLKDFPFADGPARQLCEVHC